MDEIDRLTQHGIARQEFLHSATLLLEAFLLGLQLGHAGGHQTLRRVGHGDGGGATFKRGRRQLLALLRQLEPVSRTVST